MAHTSAWVTILTFVLLLLLFVLLATQDVHGKYWRLFKIAGRIPIRTSHPAPKPRPSNNYRPIGWHQSTQRGYPHHSVPRPQDHKKGPNVIFIGQRGHRYRTTGANTAKNQTTTPPTPILSKPTKTFPHTPLQRYAPAQGAATEQRVFLNPDVVPEIEDVLAWDKSRPTLILSKSTKSLPSGSAPTAAPQRFDPFRIPGSLSELEDIFPLPVPKRTYPIYKQCHSC